MPVRYTPPAPADLLPVPGVRLGTAAAKIKRWERDDLLVAAFDAGTVAAGVFTEPLLRRARHRLPAASRR